MGAGGVRSRLRSRRSSHEADEVRVGSAGQARRRRQVHHRAQGNIRPTSTRPGRCTPWWCARPMPMRPSPSATRPRPLAMPGVKLVLTAADVGHLGGLPCLAPLPNTDGSHDGAAALSGAGRRHRAARRRRGRHGGGRDARGGARRRRGDRDRLRRRCPPWPRSTMRSPPRRAARSGRRRRATSPTTRTLGDKARDRRRLRGRGPGRRA